MRKLYFLLLTVLFAASANAQLTGTKNIPGDYADLATAITDLNTQGVGAGGVTLNLLAGNPQTAPAGGYSITATGTVANQITLQGNGNIITASGALVVGALNDAIFKLIGADHVTLTGFVMQENAANTTTAAASNNMTEWGVALLYATSTDGAQNCTIQNNTIDLNRTYQNTFGIYSNSTHTATAVTTSVTATTTAGGNSGLKIYTNNITDINIGILVVGPTAAADHNDGLDIGGASLATGNTITNYGTTGTFSSYANVSGTVNGILVRNTKSYNVSYNTITSSSGASGVTAGTLRGIYVVAASNQPTGTFTNNINNNTLSITSHVVTGTVNGIIVESTTSSATSTTNINNNNFTTLTHSIAAASGANTAISQLGSTTAGPLNHSISGNTFTNITATTTGSFTFISNSWARPTSGTGNINNNSIVTAFSKTGAGGTITLYTSNSVSGATINEINTNNNFSNITVTGATTIAGWASTDGGSPIKTVTGNTFTNWTGGTSAVTGLAVSFSGSSTVSGNLVSNISSGGAITGIASSSGINTLTGNTVHTLVSTGAAAVTGMSVTGGTTQIVSKNKIYNLEANNASGTVNGILVSAGTTVTIQNNLVGDLRTPIANAANPLVGINITGSTTANVYFNTVWINGSSSGALFGASSISASTTPALTLRNNIFVNTSTPAGATGFASAYRRSSTTLTTYNAASNNNLFYAATPGPNNLIFFDGTNSDQTLAAYKTRVSTRDAASVTENPPFLSTTGSSANFLHINTAIATQVESAATPVAGITDDYDGDVRNVTTPDIGADEGNFILLDLTAPGISYTNLPNTLCAADVALSAVIADASGVNTVAGTKPRVYYKKTTNANSLGATNDNTTDGWKYTEATNASSPFNFTLNLGLINGGVATGDVIQYFVVAQDLNGTPNVAINSGTFAVAPTSVALTAAAFPIGGTINSYSILSGGISGTVTVGAAGTYTSLTGAGGLFATLNAGGLTGNLNVTLLDVTQTENGVTALNSISYGCGGPFTLTITPASGVAVTITGSNTNAILKLNGADNVTIDGLNTGGSSLFVTNTNATGLSELWIGSASASDGATNNTIRNTTFAGFSNTGTVGGIIIGSGTTLGNPAESPNNNITIEGCTFIRQQNGIFASGNASSFDQNMVINQNTFGSTVAADKLTFRGLSLQNAANFTISNNTIAGVVSTTASSATMTGISVFNGISGGAIFNNKISDIKQTNTTGWGSNGIGLFSTSTASGLNVYNNFISDVASQGFNGTTATDNGYGIMINSGGGYNIYFNTVVLNTNQGAGAASGITAAINLASGLGVGAINLQNNILGNSQTVGANRYAILSASANTTFASINYNDYYTAGPNLGFIGSNRVDLAAVQAGFGGNANSINFLPTFVSLTDLHLDNTLGANWCLNGSGIVIPGITTDIDGNTRSTGTAPNGPDMGADEFTAIGDAVATPSSQTVCTGVPITTIVLSGTATSFNWTRDNTVAVTGIAASGTGDISGTLTNTTASPVTVTFTIFPVNAQGCVGPSITATVTVNPDNTIILSSGGGTDAQTVCINTPITNITYTTTGATGANFSGLPTGVNGSWAADVVTISGAPTVAGSFNYTVTLTGGCGVITANGSITVTPDNTITLSSGPGTNAQMVCINTPITNITYTTTGATGANFSGLPTGVTGSWAADVVTISGTPTVAGPFNYTVTLTGGCGVITANGSITVTPDNTITLSSGPGTNAQTVCINTPITNITYNTTGATGANFSGLPTGVTGSWLANVVTISGTPTLAGPFNYTVTLTGGCGVTTANGSITVNPSPTVGGVVTQPLTCVSADGAIDITASGTPGPYTYAWTTVGGSGLVPAQEDQSGLTVGQYTVVVTDQTTSCQQTAVFNVIGPGGCAVCPVVGTITSNPTPTTCINSTVSLNASGLTFMGVTYGIEFKYSNTPLADPYTGGTSIATIPNGGLTGGGTGAATSTSFGTAGNYYIYAILSPVPIDPSCRPSAVTFLQVNPTTTITSVTATPNPVCIGSTTQLNSTVSNNPPGYSLAPFVNYGAQANAGPVGDDAVSGAINIGFPFTYFGTTYTQFGISTNGNIQLGAGPYSSPFTNQAIPTVGAQENYVALDWDDWIANPGNITYTTVGVAPNRQLIVSYSGLNHFFGAGTGTLTGQIVLYETSNLIDIVNVSVISNNLGTQGVEDAAGTTGLAVAGRNNENFSSANTTWRFSTGSSFIYTWTANPIGAQAGISDPTIPNPVATVNVNAIYTLAVADAATGCSSSSSVTVTTNPIPTVNAVANQVVCNGAPLSVSFSGAVSGTVYNWTNDNTAIGLGASGTGNLSFTATNAGLTPISATITVTPTYTNGGTTCTGTPISFTITVNPTPTVTCPGNITVSNTVGFCGAAVTYSTSSTGTPAPVITYSFSGATTGSGSGNGSGSFFNVGTTTVTITATNTCAAVTCTFTVTVNDTQAPVITCPAPVTVSCAAAVPPVNTGSVSASDNCPGVVITHIGDVISAQTCANRYTLTRTYRATDAAGNFTNCTQIITVNDVTPPSLTCPAPITVSCAGAVPAPNIAAVTGVSDNCGGVVTVTFISDVISNQTCANRYTITRTYRATDVCGNFAECTQIITVNDVTPPTLTCPAPITVSCAGAVPAPNIASVTGVSDNCGGVVTVTFISDVISNQTCANRYTITRTYRATDVCGNFAQCTQIITVNDVTAPVITCPANITVTTPVGSCSAVVNFTPTATDNCGGAVTIVSSPASGSAFPIGTTTVTSTATDACGNTSTCTFTVTVNDGQLPVITTQPANRTVCAGTNATFNVVATNAVSYQWQQWNGSAWVNIAGATASSFTVSNTTVAMNTNAFRVIVNGLCTVLTSNVATLFVNAGPTVVITATPPPSILPNQTTTLHATTFPAGGGTFTWFYNGTVIPGETTSSLGPLTINQLGTYRVVYTDGNGCVGTSANFEVTGAVSNEIWVYPNPNFGQFQVRFFNQTNEPATVNVYNAAGQKVYQRSIVTGGTTYTQIDIDLGFKANGIYIVQVVNGSGKLLAAKRIIVQSR
ncbi:MAG: HYR domain-containing protein [Chitinophagaceae bacterium]|nr:HYR domain-containing protein [Chitinophagaceae bacterium]